MRKKLIFGIIASILSFLLIWGSFQIYGMTQNSKKGQLSEIEIGNVTNTNPIRDSDMTSVSSEQITNESSSSSEIDFDEDTFNSQMKPKLLQLTNQLNKVIMNSDIKTFDNKFISDKTYNELRKLIAGTNTTQVTIKSFVPTKSTQVADSVQALYNVIYTTTNPKKEVKTFKLNISMIIDFKSHEIESVSKGE